MLVGNDLTRSMNVRFESMPPTPSDSFALNSGLSVVYNGVTLITADSSSPQASTGNAWMIGATEVACTAIRIGSSTSARMSYLTSRSSTRSPRRSQRTTRSPTGIPAQE